MNKKREREFVESQPRVALLSLLATAATLIDTGVPLKDAAKGLRIAYKTVNAKRKPK